MSVIFFLKVAKRSKENANKGDGDMKRGWREGVIGINVTGETKVARYFIKTTEEETDYGIDGGKIIKLQIKIDGETVVDYERGWEVEPESEPAKIAYAICLASEKS